MKLLYFKSNWEMGGAPLADFIQRTKADGFDGAEIFLGGQRESAEVIGEELRAAGLELIAQIHTHGQTPDDHIASLVNAFTAALPGKPLLINGHIGKDFFPFEDNCRIFRRGCELSAEHGVTLTFETHRGRPTYAAHETRRLLEEIPEMVICADFSHWFCVHESDLGDQPENVDCAIPRTRHLHARVGHPEGPQVPDPHAPEWRATVDLFFQIWQRIIDTRSAAGAEILTIAPEFGPPHYMPVEPYTQRPLADTWEVNARFRKTLAERLVA